MAELCLVCNADASRLKYRIEGHEIRHCHICDVMWLVSPPRSEELKTVYDEHYFSNTEFYESDESIYGYTDYISERINRQKEYRRIVELACDTLTAQEDRKWLDIGCGLGFLLDTAYDYGFEATGVEFSAVLYPKTFGTFLYGCSTPRHQQSPGAVLSRRAEDKRMAGRMLRPTPAHSSPTTGQMFSPLHLN